MTISRWELPFLISIFVQQPDFRRLALTVQEFCRLPPAMKAGFHGGTCC
jgi:hypothetical protein